MTPQLIVEQRITPFANIYSIYKAKADGSKDELVAYAQQKRITFKEKVTFYTDNTKNKTSFTFRAEKVMDVHGRYFVEDNDGKLIGTFKKDFKKSLLKSTWHVLDKNDKPKIMIAESNLPLALARRFGGSIPIIGEFIDIIVTFLRYHFVLTEVKTNELVGKYKKTTLFRDHYVLSMSDSAYKDEDWRVLASLAVGLDALQSR